MGPEPDTDGWFLTWFGWLDGARKLDMYVDANSHFFLETSQVASAFISDGTETNRCMQHVCLFWGESGFICSTILTC